MCGIQGQLGVTHITLTAVGSVVALNAQEVDLIYQRLADAVIEYWAFHQVVKARLRQARQQLFLVDSFGQLFGKATQARQCAAWINMQHRFGKASQIGQQLVAGPEELEIN